MAFSLPSVQKAADKLAGGERIDDSKTAASIYRKKMWETKKKRNPNDPGTCLPHTCRPLNQTSYFLTFLR